MKMKLALCMTGILACGCLVSPATVFAAKASQKQMAKTYNSSPVADMWSGAYFGTYFGAGSGNVDGTYEGSLVSTEFDFGSDEDVTSTYVTNAKANGNIQGSIADLFLGYNFYLARSPRIIFGGQLEGSYFSDLAFDQSGVTRATRVRSSAPTEVDRLVAVLSNQQNLSSMFSFDVRAGYLFSPSVLLYVLGGGTEGHFNVISTGVASIFAQASVGGGEIDNIAGVFDGSQWVLGYNVGAGLEYKFNSNWSARAEYRFVNFSVSNKISLDSSVLSDASEDAGSASQTQSLDTNVNLNLGKLGVVYRFA